MGVKNTKTADSPIKVVRARGLEPPILAEPDPKSGVSAIPPRAQPINSSRLFAIALVVRLRRPPLYTDFLVYAIKCAINGLAESGCGER